jgi:hypothetical protein
VSTSATTNEREEGLTFQPRFDASGLVTCVATDAATEPDGGATCGACDPGEYCNEATTACEPCDVDDHCGAMCLPRAGGSSPGWLGLARLPPSCSLFQPARAASARSLSPQARLWAMANHSATALTFRRPRTSSRISPRFRAWALTHSAVLARWR